MLKAIKEGDEEALKAMIKAGKNLAEPNKDGWLPLHEAAYYGQLTCLKVLQQGEWGQDSGRGLLPFQGFNSLGRRWGRVQGKILTPVAALKSPSREEKVACPHPVCCHAPGLSGQESLIPRTGVGKG